jgi:phytoene dehydrogenase-like protein
VASSATITVVGGGLAGLTAAIACAEQGASVVLHEAHSTLGGRARSTPAPYIANDGASRAAEDGLARLEAVFDLAYPEWRREHSANYRTGDLDLPGQTWRDRPAINQGHGRYLIGDAVAATGLLAEVSINSALNASQLALA